MKKKEDQVLREKLITAVKKILKENNKELTIKIEKTIKKSLKQIVKKSRLVKNKPVAAKK